MYILGYIIYLNQQLGQKPEPGTSTGLQADRAAGHGVWQGARNAVRRALVALRLRHERLAAIRQLDRLPDAALRDIGLDRAKIPATVTALLRARETDEEPASAPDQAPTSPFGAAPCC